MIEGNFMGLMILILLLPFIVVALYYLLPWILVSLGIIVAGLLTIACFIGVIILVIKVDSSDSSEKQAWWSLLGIVPCSFAGYWLARLAIYLWSISWGQQL